MLFLTYKVMMKNAAGTDRLGHSEGLTHKVKSVGLYMYRGLDKGSEASLYGCKELWDQPDQWAPEIPSSFDHSPCKSSITDISSPQWTDQALIWTWRDLEKSQARVNKTPANKNLSSYLFNLLLLLLIHLSSFMCCWLSSGFNLDTCYWFYCSFNG